jgi:ABC-type Fe3+-hydroxamate transport system substrate-binding protein
MLRRAEADAGRPKVFCPIWRDPWMTIGRETYIHDMIELCGGENLFAALGTPAADRRYPIIDLEDVVRAQPDVILLPDEPYAFDEADRKRMAEIDCPAARDARIHLIDGTLVSWYGPRIAEAIRVLARIFANRA